jgi:hypothetical protein
MSLTALIDMANTTSGTKVLVPDSDMSCDHCQPGSTHYTDEIPLKAWNIADYHPGRKSRSYCSEPTALVHVAAFCHQWSRLTGTAIDQNVQPLVDAILRGATGPAAVAARRNGGSSALLVIELRRS